jgi:hypothetical protein
MQFSPDPWGRFSKAHRHSATSSPAPAITECSAVPGVWQLLVICTFPWPSGLLAPPTLGSQKGLWDLAQIFP